jgi:hypothetical protein
MNGNLEICLNHIRMPLLKKSVKKKKYFSCFAPLLLREMQIFKFLAPAKKKKCSRPGKKKEPETCRLLLISRERESRVSVLRLFFFFTEGGGR